MAMTDTAWSSQRSSPPPAAPYDAPYFQSPRPESVRPDAPAQPRRSEPVRRPANELAETLSLPPGLHGQTLAANVIPRTAAEARVLHTHLSRSLGRTYREKWGVVLRADRSGIESMQVALRARFPVPTVQTFEDACEVRAHGAFLSEVLARTFGAEWHDIASRELAHWRMTTPRGLQVWPFGRILGVVLHGNANLLRCYDVLALHAAAAAARQPEPL